MLTAYEQGVDAWCFNVAPPTEQPTTDLADPELPALPTIRTDEDLDTFLWQTFQVKLPNVQVCPHHSTPWRAFHEAYFARTPVAVWKASRGFGGKSFTLALLALTEALTLRADVNVLGGSGEQSKRVLESIEKLWELDTAPRAYLKSEPTSQKQRLHWGNRIVALLASQASVRGPHPQRLRMDEVDEAKKAIVESALGQPMSKGWVLSQVVLSSTHQYPKGTMTWAIQEAASKGWPVHEWCLHETREPHGWLTDQEIERKRAIMTVASWQTEVELQEPSAEGRAIVPECVKAAFREDLVLEAPVPDAKYGTGGDWAKKVNHTVVPTIRHDVKPARVVAIERTQRKPYPVMVKILNDRVALYGGAAAHDNSGLGSVVADLIEVPQGRIEHFEFAGRERNEMLSEYIADLEHGLIQWPKDPTNAALDAAFKEHLYATVGDVYGRKDEGHLPDTISAAALAWRACKQILAASGTKDPEPSDAPHLQDAPTPGRLTQRIYQRRGKAVVSDEPRPGTQQTVAPTQQDPDPGPPATPGRVPIRRKRSTD